MKISEIIDNIKCSHYGMTIRGPINEVTTRDQVLYGNANQECTGIVTTCWANIDVIKKAHELGANLIICHEALFWNHGDHKEWLKDNKTFIEKIKLLDDTGIVVWRNHDYIHSGIRINDFWTDGIFYGIMQTLGWEEYLIEKKEKTVLFKIPPIDVKNLANQIKEKLHLNKIKTIGRTEGLVEKIYLSGHIQGRDDNEKISLIENEDIDLIMSFELIDYTVSEYIKDSAILGRQKTIFAIGHFNLEEAGMEYFAHYLRDKFDEDLKIRFIPSSDMYDFL